MTSYFQRWLTAQMKANTITITNWTIFCEKDYLSRKVLKKSMCTLSPTWLSVKPTKTVRTLYCVGKGEQWEMKRNSIKATFWHPYFEEAAQHCCSSAFPNTAHALTRMPNWVLVLWNSLYFFPISHHMVHTLHTKHSSLKHTKKYIIASPTLAV